MSCKSDCNTGRCVISCESQSYQPGTRTMRCSDKTIAFLSNAVKQPKEVGGLMEPNFQTGFLEILSTAGGGKDSVEIPVGVFQFHTHPNACRSKSACYFEFPSENDMSLIARDSMRGVVAHFVITLERVYRVAISPALRLKFARDPDRIEAVFDHFAEVMLRLQDRAQVEGIGVMPELLKEWLREAKGQGFDVTIFSTPAEIRERVEAV